MKIFIVAVDDYCEARYAFMSGYVLINGSPQFSNVSGAALKNRAFKSLEKAISYLESLNDDDDFSIFTIDMEE